jgi:hypothetical protein
MIGTLKRVRPCPPFGERFLSAIRLRYPFVNPHKTHIPTPLLRAQAPRWPKEKKEGEFESLVLAMSADNKAVTG